MKTHSTKSRILEYVRLYGLVTGAGLENNAIEWSTKGSTISRRARELADEGKLLRIISPKGTVSYRFIANILTYNKPKDIHPANQVASNTELFERPRILL